MGKPMHEDEAEVAEKVVRMLAERDPFEDGEVEISYSDARGPGVLRGPASVSARVLAAADVSELSGLYEVTVTVRKITE